MSIDDMPAGREMDALVAEKVMDVEPRISWELLDADETATAVTFDTKVEAEAWRESHLKRFPDSWVNTLHVGSWKHYRNYSTDISAAWQVVEKFAKGGDTWECYLEYVLDGWICTITAPDKVGAWSKHEAAPLAICRAALKAVEAEVKP